MGSVVFSGYASSLSVLSDTEKELGVVLVDMGAGTTDISIYVEGSVAYSSVLPIGARHITNDLAIGLRDSLESAEKIKIFLSDKPKRLTRLEEEEEQKPKDHAARDAILRSDEIDLSHLNLPEDLRKVSQKTLIDGIIRPRLNEIFTMVGLEIKKSGYGGQSPAGIVITGGGAKTIGVVEAAKRMLAMPVRIGVPAGMKGIIDEVQETNCSAVIGLVIYGSKHELAQSSMPFGISLPKMGKIGLPSGNFGKKIIHFIKSFIP